MREEEDVERPWDLPAMPSAERPVRDPGNWDDATTPDVEPEDEDDDEDSEAGDEDEGATDSA